MVTLDRAGSRVRGLSVVAVVWGLVGLGWGVALVATGSAVVSVLLWGVVVLSGVLVPGIALVRAVRVRPSALVEDVGWGIPAGCLVAMVGWAVGVVSPVGVPAWVFGPLVTAGLLLVPGVRRRVLARPAPGWGAGAHAGLAGVVAVVVGWMVVDFLRLNPPVPAAGGTGYYPDTVFQLAVVGQLRHSLALTYPLVAGEPYSYSWFAHAVLAHLADAGPDTADLVLRLAPAALLPAVILTGAVVARELSGRVVAGPVFAALMGIAGSTVAIRQAEGYTVPTVQTYWWASLTTAFGWLAILATAGVALAIVLGRPGGSAPVALFVPFAVLAVGAKPSNLAVLLGGAGLVWLAALVARRPARRAFVVAVVLGVLLLAARVTIYGGGDYGLRADLLGGFRRRAAQLFPGLTGARADDLALTLPEVSTVAVLAVLVLYLLPLLPRLAGLVLLDRREPAPWFFAGVAIAALGAVAVFRHPGESETFFLVSAYPVLLAGSAWGLAAGWERLGRPVVPVVAGVVFGAVAALAVALLSPEDPRAALAGPYGRMPTAAEVAPWRQAAHLLAPLAALAVVLAVAAGAAWWWSRGDGTRRSRVTAAVVAAVLGTGVLSTGVYLTAAAPTIAQRAANDPASAWVTPDEAAAARWLAANSAPDDVFATNRVCVQGQPGPAVPPVCLAKTFAMSALSGRTAYVGGWAYADRNLDTAWEAGVWWSSQPFWDQRRLAAELTAFTAPSPAGLGTLRDAGVHWLVADTRGAPADTAALDRLATRRFTTPGVRVWELRAE